MGLIYVFMLFGFLLAEYTLYKASRNTGIKTIFTDHLIIGAGGMIIGLFVGFIVVEILIFLL
jgi:hypothetical protein